MTPMQKFPSLQYLSILFQIMKDQPKTEQLVRKFYWCQWDVLHQRLYYIHYKKQLVDDQAKVQAILSSMQFYNKAQYDSIVRGSYSLFYKHY